MKEIKKLSELISPFVISLTKDTGIKKKIVYNIWADLVEEKKLPLDSILEDINKSTITIRVNHSGSAQQIRLKRKQIIEAFNKKLSISSIKDIKILIDIRDSV